MTADGNIRIYGSDWTAAPTGNINLTAGNGLYLYSIDNIDKSSTDVKKRSSWLGVRYNKDHTNDTRQELSQLPTTLIGDKAYNKSGGDTVLKGTIFNTSNTDDIQVGFGPYAEADAKLILDVVQHQVITTHNQEKESTVWMKTVEERDTVTTAQLPKFNQTPITSPNGVVIGVPVDVDISDNNQAKLEIQTSQAELGKIALNLSKQPGYEYLAELDKNNEINWVQVQLIQEHFKFEQEGLTPAAAALIAIAVSMATGGVGGAAGMGATLTGTTGAMGAASTAAFSSLASQAAVTLINNKGDISKTLKDMASSDTIRNMATAALTAGVGAKLNLAGSPDYGFSQNLANGIGRGLTNAVADAALNGVSFEDALKNSLRNSLVDVLSAEAFAHGTKGIDSDATDEFARNLAHKLAAGGVGCLSAEAKNQNCDAGALGAIVGEMVGDYMVELGAEGDLSPDQISKITNTAKLAAGSVAMLAGVDVNVAASSAGTAVENNSIKAATTVIKVGAKTVKIFVKNGKVNLGDIKGILKKEGYDIVDDLITLADGKLTLADAFAVVDLVVGTNVNNRQTKIDMIVSKRGLGKNPYQFKELSDLAEKKGYITKTIGGEEIMYNKKGNPSYLVKSNTSHSGDVYKGFNNEKSAIDASRKNSSKPNQRTGSYDIHLNRVAD